MSHSRRSVGINVTEGLSKKYILVFALTAAAVVAIDQVLKALVSAFMSPGNSFTLIPKIVSITYVKNVGAAFGLLAGNGQLVLWGALVIVVLTLVWFFQARHSRSFWSFVALGLIIGGACGNLADRLFRGRVIDYVDLGWWPVFNFADVAIVAGVIILLSSLLFDVFKSGNPKTKQETGVDR